MCSFCLINNQLTLRDQLAEIWRVRSQPAPPRRPQPPIIRWNYPEYLCWRYITLPQFVFQKEKAFSLSSSKTSASFEDRKWEADIPWIKSERTCTRRLRADVCNNNSANVKSLSAEVTAPAKADAQTPPQPKDSDGKKCSFKTIRRKGNRDFVFGPNRWSNKSPAASENQRGFTPCLRPHTLQPNVWLLNPLTLALYNNTLGPGLQSRLNCVWIRDGVSDDTDIKAISFSPPACCELPLPRQQCHCLLVV